LALGLITNANRKAGEYIKTNIAPPCGVCSNKKWDSQMAGGTLEINEALAAG